MKIKEIKIINNITMKQNEYCTPEMVSLEALSENVLCVSKVVLDGNGNEKFEFEDVEW